MNELRHEVNQKVVLNENDILCYFNYCTMYHGSTFLTKSKLYELIDQFVLEFGLNGLREKKTLMNDNYYSLLLKEFNELPE